MENNYDRKSIVPKCESDCRTAKIKTLSAKDSAANSELEGSRQNTSIVLPICLSPLVTHGFLALEYSVFEACRKDITPALINVNFNIASGIETRVQYTNPEEDRWLVKSKVMHQQHLKFAPDMFLGKTEEIVDIIYKYMSEGYYLSGNFNSFYIKAKPAYNCYNTYTAYLIYGINPAERILYAVGKTSRKLFDSYEISYDEFIESVMNQEKNLGINLNFLKFYEKFKNEVNLAKVYNGIFDYVHSCNKDDGPVPEGKAANYRYGLNCYRDFQYNLKYMFEYRTYIESSSYHPFLEHHRIMKVRLDYLTKIGIIKDVTIVQRYSQITSTAEDVMNSCLEYNKTQTPQLIKTIYSNLTYIITEEEKVLCAVLELLKQILSSQ